MADDLSNEVSHRFAEVQTLLQSIRRGETSEDVLERDQVRIMKGLFFVLLYAQFEKSVNLIVDRACLLINSDKVKNANVVPIMHAAVSDAYFRSVINIGPTRKWRSRRELLLRLTSDEIAEIPDGVFAAELQNVWCSTLREIFAIFGIEEDIVPQARYIGYIDEIVDKRNSVAHGRETPSVVGASLVLHDLEVRYQAIYETTIHIMDVFKQYVIIRKFARY
jgi:sulfur transfer complex TusBCD TusB component (DsrH family)